MLGRDGASHAPHDQRVARRLLRWSTSSWALGALTAVASWNVYVAFFQPGVGLDRSWWAAMFMAAHRGMHFGDQIIFTYGPLAFLAQAWSWYGNLGALGFLYTGGLHVALSISLVWALRRTLHPALACLAAFFVLIAASEVDVTLALTAIWCLTALSPEPPRYAANVVLIGGSVIGAIQTLVELRSGPFIFLICAVTLLGLEHWRKRVPIFLGCFVVSFAVARFAAGQALGNLPDFVSNGAQIVSGYSEAMGVPDPAGIHGQLEIVIVAVAIVVAAALGCAPGRRRQAGALAIAVASFSLYKEAIVRAGGDHRAIFFATTAALGVGIAFGRRRVLASAYTASLDRLNADALRSPSGPQRILRENTVAVDPSHIPDIDFRSPAWDPPAQAIAMLCDYVPLRTTRRWQVLGKVANRCGPPQLINSIHGGYGQVVMLPLAQPGTVLYAKVFGAAVTGLERVKTLLCRADIRYAIVNGVRVYRLIPGTAADGLIMDASPTVDYPAPFALSPHAHTIRFAGLSGALTIDLYEMRVGTPRTIR